MKPLPVEVWDRLAYDSRAGRRTWAMGLRNGVDEVRVSHWPTALVVRRFVEPLLGETGGSARVASRRLQHAIRLA